METRDGLPDAVNIAVINFNAFCFLGIEIEFMFYINVYLYFFYCGEVRNTNII